MPKLEEMAQLSRPFQIALVGVCLFAGVWFFALQGRSTSTSTGGSASAPAVTASAPSVSKPTTSTSEAAVVARAKVAATTGHIYHGPVPGLEGLTRDIARAHRAVAAVGASPSAPTSSATHTTSSTTATAQHPASTSTAVAPRTTVKHQPIKAKSGAGRTPARQVLVEHALHEGKIAVILFWNPKGTDDAIVSSELKLLEAVHHLIRPLAHTPQLRRALKASGLELEKRFAAFFSPSSQVASYGSITRGVQVYMTPTLLVINKRGQTTALTGLQDAFSIEQAIDEARNS
ncbi:MAG TPA: hypothetical protein VGX72_03645 [Solirubrobacteraceae bacterium]|jgi:hypothetical protein|nr:hypothetical protein [Solirubrobacteraceae bacterium]